MNDQFTYNEFKDMSCGNFLSYLLTLSANELSLLALGLGYLCSVNLDANQKNSLGNFFELIGQLLLAISAQEMVFNTQPTRQELQQQINQLKIEIEQLKKANP